MPWNGSGQFNRTTGVFTGATVWDDSRVAGRTVRTDDHDTHDEDIATGLENTVTRDGQNSPSENLPMATFRHTGVGNAAARTDYAAAGQIQDGGLTHVAPASVGGTGDAITLSPSPGITAYVAGQRWSFVAEATNTGATTIDVSSLGTRAVQKLGAALVAGDIAIGDLVVVEDDGTQFQMISPVEARQLIGTATASSDAAITFTWAGITYSYVEIMLSNALPATDDVDLYIRTSTDGGSSYDSGASDYSYSVGFTSSRSSTGDTKIVCNLASPNAIGNVAGEGWGGKITIIDPSATDRTQIVFLAGHKNPSGTSFRMNGIGQRESAADVDGVQFSMSSGNIASGEFIAWGIR